MTDTVSTKRLRPEELTATLGLASRSPDFSLDETMRPSLRDPSTRDSSPPRPSTPPRDHFEVDGNTIHIKEKIAEGGMGIISVAEQSALRRDVAVKSLRDEFLDERFVDRFMREARITGLVEHPNIVPVYELRSDDRGVPLMVMKRIEGVSWRAMIRDPDHEAFPPDHPDRLSWHLEVLMRVCDAIHYSHSRGILHLDLKPDNVMIGAYREVYVVDWGVACSTREVHRGWLPMADEVAEVVGTPAYIAPEMVDIGHSSLTERTDVYLLGAILHEILVGRPPHRGKNLQATLYAAYEAEPPEFPDFVPGELAEIAQRAMDPSPSRRLAGPEAFRAAISDYLRHRTSAALTADLSERLPELRAAIANEPEENARPWDDRAFVRAFDECRFGFAQALKQWPQNARARRSLNETLLLMAEFFLERGDVSAAHGTLAEVIEPTELQRSRLESLKRRASLHHHQTQRLLKVGWAQDHAIGRRERGIYTLVIAITLMLPVAVFFGLEQSIEIHWVPWHSYIFEGIAVAAMAMGVAIGGRRLAPNTVSRRMLWAFLMLSILVFLQRFIGAQVGVSSGKEGLAMDLFMFAAGSTLIATLSDIRFIGAAATFLAASFATAAFPDWAFLWICLASIMGPGVVAAIWIWEGEKARKAARGAKG